MVSIEVDPFRQLGQFSPLSSYRHLLFQVFEEIAIAKRRYGKLNTIVMNAVLEACVHCGDIDLALRTFNEMSKPDNCGLDDVSYGTLLKVLYYS